MKPGGGRSKGNGFEREIAKQIVEAFANEYDGITQKDCYRTPSSGGHRYAKKQDPGDLVISPRLRKLFPYSVECKSYKHLPIHDLLLPKVSSKSVFNTWWKQSMDACTLMVHPLLIFKQNRGRPLVMVNWKHSRMPDIPILQTRVACSKYNLVVMDFKMWLDAEASGALR